MKTKVQHTIAALALLALATLILQPSITFGQGTAFSYQGRLNDGGGLANGSYDLTFTLFDVNAGGVATAGPVTNSAVAVSNGLFSVTVDFGDGVFTGTNYWLELAVQTNGGSGFSTLSPRQPILPAPYAIMANSASNLLGSLSAARLGGGTAGISISGNAATATTATNLSGPFSGDVTGTQGATVVSTIDGVSAANVASGASAANAATSANTANTIVLRDGSGSFSAGSITANNLTLNSTLYLPFEPTIYAGGSLFIYEDYYENFSAGLNAGNLSNFGNDNTAVGGSALESNFEGNYNTANGALALSQNSNGSDNTGIGYQALMENAGGNDNTAVGYEALADNTDGNESSADGAYTLTFNTTGYGNVANGYGALNHNTVGYNDTANGWESLLENSSGAGNTADGAAALINNTTGDNNTADGLNAISYNTSGAGNTGIGKDALLNCTNGNYNVAVGFSAGANITSGSSNIDIGNFGLATDNNIIRIGTAQTATYLAGTVNGMTLTGDSVHDNTVVGYQALNANTTGDGNTAIGALALHANTVGYANVAIGVDALWGNIGGYENVAVGEEALYNNTNGIYNTAIGMAALDENRSGSDNVANGYNSMLRNTSGSGNIGDGYNTLQFCTTGSYNIAIGYNAGGNITTGSSNIDIGNVGVSSDTNTIRIGTNQVATYIAGIYGKTAASGVAVYVNSSGQLGTLTSSARFKRDIHSMADASDVLLALRPVTFKYKSELDPQGVPQFGLIAEEVEKVDPDLVARDDQGKIYTVRYQAVDAMLLNEFQKEHRKVEEQSTEIQTLQEKLDELQAVVKQIAARK